MAWQSIRRMGGGEGTAEKYVKMFWIVKPDADRRTERVTAQPQD